MWYQKYKNGYQVSPNKKIKFNVKSLSLKNMSIYTLKNELIAEIKDDYIYIQHPYTWDGTTIIGKFYETDNTLLASLLHDILYQLGVTLSLDRDAVDLLYSQYLDIPINLLYYKGVNIFGGLYYDKDTSIIIK